MTYTLTPSNIAACCYVDHEGKRETFIYLAADKMPATLTRELRHESDAFLALPRPVQLAIVAHFSAVFALPVEQRGAFLKTVPAIEVTP